MLLFAVLPKRDRDLHGIVHCINNNDRLSIAPLSQRMDDIYCVYSFKCRESPFSSSLAYFNILLAPTICDIRAIVIIGLHASFNEHTHQMRTYQNCNEQHKRSLYIQTYIYPNSRSLVLIAEVFLCSTQSWPSPPLTGAYPKSAMHTTKPGERRRISSAGSPLSLVYLLCGKSLGVLMNAYRSETRRCMMMIRSALVHNLRLDMQDL